MAERELQKKRADTFNKKKQGRHIPCQQDEERERELAIIATKGVVQLFNTVSEFQASSLKEAIKVERERKAKQIQILGLEGQAPGTSDNIFKKI